MNRNDLRIITVGLLIGVGLACLAALVMMAGPLAGVLGAFGALSFAAVATEIE